MKSRPSWDQYFMDMVHLVGSRSTCLRRQVGAVIVKDKRILSTGYNGAPSGCEHCIDRGCLRKEQEIPSGERHELCRAVHAEQNAIIYAAQFGVSIKDSTIYLPVTPCFICAKMIVNAGIKEVCVEGEYPDKLALEVLKEANIKVRTLKS